MNLYSNATNWNHVPGLKSAMSTVIGHTSLNAKEYAVILSPNGTPLREYQGDEHHVELDNLVARNVIVHSHPQPSPLSPEDIFLATVHEATIFAIGTDESIYASKGWNRLKTRPSEMQEVGNILRNRTFASIDLGMDELTANIAVQHLTLLEFAKLGKLDYHYTLGKVASKALADFSTVVRAHGLAHIFGGLV
jgi:hypothetical protein